MDWVLCFCDSAFSLVPFYEKDERRWYETLLMVLAAAVLDRIVSFVKLPSEILREMILSLILVLCPVIYRRDRSPLLFMAALMCRLFADAVSCLVFPLSAMAGIRYGDIPPIQMQMMYQVLSLLAHIVCRKILRSVPLTDDSAMMPLFLIILPASLFSQLILQGYFKTEKVNLLWMMYFVTAVFTSAVFAVSYRQMKLAMDNRKKDMVIHNLHLSRGQIQLIEAESREVRKLRHDMNHHLNTLSVLLQEEKYAEAVSYLQKVKGITGNVKPAVWSGNVYLDAVLNYKLSLYPDCKFSLDIQMNPELIVDEADLGVILSNLIDNAVEEVKRDLLGKEISIMMKKYENSLLIRVKNPVLKEKDMKTEKKDHRSHGFGLEIIRTIVEQYGGSLDLIQENGIFETDIVLYGKEKRIS